MHIDILAIAFLNDIENYINTLNVDLQDEKLTCDLIKSVLAFHRKLNISQQDEHQNSTHFLTILECKNYYEVHRNMFVLYKVL